MSEHKFLRILRGYADGMTVQELERTTHVTGRTIRDIYKALRERMPEAISANPDRFGGAGELFVHPNASKVSSAIQESRRFKRYKMRHTPRLRCASQEEALVLEKFVRLLCALDLRHAQLDRSACGETCIVLKLASAYSSLHPREPIAQLAILITGARPYAHHVSRFYEDYRRHLIESPLGPGALR